MPSDPQVGDVVVILTNRHGEYGELGEVGTYYDWWRDWAVYTNAMESGAWCYRAADLEVIGDVR